MVENKLKDKISNETGSDSSKLAQADQFFRQLVDSVKDYAIFALDIQGRIVTWNAGAKRLKGYSSEEIIGKHISTFYTKEDRDREHYNDELRIATETEKYEEEGWRIRKNGSRFWANVIITKLTDQKGQHIGFSKVTRDLSERKAHEERLKDNEEKLRLMVQSVKDYAIFMLNRQGLVSSWNPGAQNLKGYTSEEIIGKHFREFYPEADKLAKKPESELEIATKEGRCEDTGWRIRKDGSRFCANVVISAMQNTKGELIGFTKVTRDLTVQREADEKLKQSYADLETTVRERTKELLAAKQVAENANITKSTFLANMSHEIRTPLGAIIGFADLIGTKEVTKTELDDYLAVVKRNSAQLLRIIDDILDLSKVEMGRMDIEHISFSLSEVIADMKSMLGLRARENSIGFEVEAETLLPEFVKSDPIRLRQILINVIGNAIKFTQKGEVKLSISFKNSLLQFTVKDTGRGITEEQAAKLFQPFTQADSATNRKFGGTGLGLSLTQGLCRAMGGEFFLKESALGKGSTFVALIKVEVPLDYKNNLNAKIGLAPKDFESDILKGMKILLIEDSLDNQQLIQIILNRMGAVVDIASDGLEGVAKAMNNTYDVVLMDIQMPYMDGMEAVRILRSRKYTTPVVALTAHAMKEQKSQAFAAGFTSFLSKPIKRQAMLELLRSIYLERASVQT